MDRYLEFEWDETKSDRNRLSRGLPFEAAVAMFDGFVLTAEDTRQDYGERRMRALGMVGGLVLHCVYTMRGDVCRVISLRRANRKERDAYQARQGGPG